MVALLASCLVICLHMVMCKRVQRPYAPPFTCCVFCASRPAFAVRVHAGYFMFGVFWPVMLNCAVQIFCEPSFVRCSWISPGSSPFLFLLWIILSCSQSFVNSGILLSTVCQPQLLSWILLIYFTSVNFPFKVWVGGSSILSRKQNTLPVFTPALVSSWPFVLEANQQTDSIKTSSLLSPKRGSKKVWQIWTCHFSGHCFLTQSHLHLWCRLLLHFHVVRKSRRRINQTRLPLTFNAQLNLAGQQIRVGPGVVRLQVAKQ